MAYKHLIPYRWRELWWQLRSGQATEEEIRLFSAFEGVQGLVIDVGANRGQFALSVFGLNQSLRILSLEANTELRWILAAIKLLHPWRFGFRMLGAGAEDSQLTLHIPQSHNTDLSPNASLAPSEFNKDYVKERLSEYSRGNHGQYHFRTRKARVRPLDSLQLAPLVIKIDVEGWELPALAGMERTLNRHHPLLMIEMNNQDLFMPWLAQRGYQFYRYHAAPAALRPLKSAEWCLNVFCLHPDSPSLIRDKLKPLMH